MSKLECMKLLELRFEHTIILGEMRNRSDVALPIDRSVGYLDPVSISRQKFTRSQHSTIAISGRSATLGSILTS